MKLNKPTCAHSGCSCNPSTNLESVLFHLINRSTENYTERARSSLLDTWCRNSKCAFVWAKRLYRQTVKLLMFLIDPPNFAEGEREREKRRKVDYLFTARGPHTMRFAPKQIILYRNRDKDPTNSYEKDFSNNYYNFKVFIIRFKSNLIH